MKPLKQNQKLTAYGALRVYGANSTLVLDNCTVLDSKSPDSITTGRGGLVYSSNPAHVVCYISAPLLTGNSFVIWLLAHG